MIRTIALAAAFSLAGGLLCAADPLQDRQEAAPATLDLHICSQGSLADPGQQPQITATITNKGSAVTLVLPGDGLESGWRTPLVGFSSIKIGKDKPKHPADVPLYRGGRCGNINALKSSEVFTLAPGKSKDLTDWIGSPQLTETGTYSVVFYYANDPGLKWQGVPLGHARPRRHEAGGKSHKCLLTSNELKLTVKPKE